MGSIFDADHPPKGVNIPRRSTLTLCWALGGSTAVEFVAPAAAKQDDPGKGKGKGAEMERSSKAHAPGAQPGPQAGETDRSAAKHERWDRTWTVGEFVAAEFTAAALRDLLGDHAAALHTGAHALPPGIAKNLQRGKPLPPGIAMKQPTGSLARVLPRVEGHEWREVGRDLVLVAIGTLIVREIVRDVLY